MTTNRKSGESVGSLLGLPIALDGASRSAEAVRKLVGAPAAGLRLVLNAAEVATLTQSLDSTMLRFDQARSTLETEVAARTRDLEITRQRLEVVIDSISDGLIACNEAGSIESFNRAAEKIFRCDASEAIGQQITRFLPAFDGNDGLFGSAGAGETSARSADGAVLCVEGSVRPTRMADGTLHVIALRDVTAVRYTRKRLREQAFLIERSRSFVVTIGATGRIAWCNPCFEGMTGYGLEQMKGRRPADFLVDSECPADAMARIRSAMKSGESFSEEMILRHASGRPFWVHLEAHPMTGEDGRVEKFMALGLDITDRKRQERQHADFVSMVSHELRTPLTVVSGALDALAMGIGGELPEACHEMIEMGQRNCVQLSTLIEDLLDINKLEAGVIRFQSQLIDIVEPVRDAVRSLVPLLNDRAMSLKSDVKTSGVQVFLDPQRLRQVVVNLLSNAIKFSPVGSSIVVRIELHEGQVRVTVQDSGQGIPAEFQPRVFEKFSRDVAVQASGKEGFGLGLCISKGLVAQMGGKISFESTVGKGSSFFVDLPVHSLADGGPTISLAGEAVT